MFQWLYTYVASVLFGCGIYCSGYTHMLLAHVTNILPVSDVCCRSASCCNINRCRKRAHVEAVPRVRGKRSGRGWSPPTCATIGTGTQHAYVQQHVVGRLDSAGKLNNMRGGRKVGAGVRREASVRTSGRHPYPYFFGMCPPNVWGRRVGEMGTRFWVLWMGEGVANGRVELSNGGGSACMG
jgi:hypothetical protein